MTVRIPMNRYNVIRNIYQGVTKKILTVCSAGCLRSPTIANELAKRNYNVRSCGAMPEYAIVPMTPELITWADYVIVVAEHEQAVLDLVDEVQLAGYPTPKVTVLDIPDSYAFADPELIKIVNQLLDGAGFKGYYDHSS